MTAYLGKPTGSNVHWVWNGSAWGLQSYGGGGGGGGGSVWIDGGNKARTTSSIYIGSGSLFASDIGADVVFFVSGARFLTGVNNRQRAVFGGDVVMSGALFFNTGAVRMESIVYNLTASGIRWMTGSEPTSGTSPNPLFEINNVRSGSIFSVAIETDGPILEVLSDHHTRISGSLYVGDDPYGRKQHVYFSGTKNITGPAARHFVVDSDSFFSGSMRISKTERQVGSSTLLYVFGTKDSALLSSQSLTTEKAVFDVDIVTSGTLYFGTGAIGIKGLLLSGSGSTPMGEQNVARIIFTKGHPDFMENWFAEFNSSMSGSLFEVTDLSGSTIMDVRSDYTIRLSGGLYIGNEGPHKNFTHFYVSGTRNVTGSAERAAIFDGDVRVSGTLSVGTGTVAIDSNEVRFGSDAKITRIGSDLRFVDPTNPSGFTLTQLGTGGGGGDTHASYVVLNATSSLANERVLTAGAGVQIVDNGPGSTVVISSNAGAAVVTTTISTANMTSGTFYVPAVREFENAGLILPITASFFPDVVAINGRYWFYHLVPDLGGLLGAPKAILTASFESPSVVGIASSSIPTTGVPARDEDFMQTLVIGSNVYIIASGSAYQAPTSTPNILTASTCNLPIKPQRGMAIIGDKIWNFGGVDPGTGLATDKIYSASITAPLTSWADVGTLMPVKRRHGTILVHDGHIYIFGGRNEANASTAGILRAKTSDPSSWTLLGNALLPAPVAYHQIAIVDRYAYIFGGFNSGATTGSWRASLDDLTVWSASSASNGSLPDIRYAAAIVVGNDGRVYHYGGTNGLSPFSRDTIFRTRHPLTCSAVSPFTWQPTDPLVGQTQNGIVAIASQMQRCGMLAQNYDVAASGTSLGSFSITTIGQWRDAGNSYITTGSVSIDSQDRAPTTIGSDVYFFVSGTQNVTGSSARIAAFGGDVKTSGSVLVGEDQAHGSVELVRKLQTSASAPAYGVLYDKRLEHYESFDAEATVTAVNIDGFYRTNIVNSFYKSYGTGTIVSLGDIRSNERFTPRSAGAGIFSGTNPAWGANWFVTGSNVQLVVTGAGVIDWMLKLKGTSNSTTPTSFFYDTPGMPMGIANLALWLRADMGFQARTGRWEDQSGNNEHFASMTGSVYRVESTVFNGRPALSFADGTLVNKTVLATATAAEAFFVLHTNHDPNGPSSANAGFSFIGADGGLGNVYPFRTDSGIYEGFGSTSRKTVGNPAYQLNRPHIVNIWSAASDWAFNAGLVNYFSTATNTFGVTGNRILGSGAQVEDADPAFNGRAFQGLIAEVIIFSRKLTSTERRTVIQYLNSRYGCGMYT